MSSKLRGSAGSKSSRPAPKGIPSLPIAKRRTFILTGAVAFITVAGTLIGATLKSKAQTEEKQVWTEWITSANSYGLQTIRLRAEVNNADQIALLESARGQLLAQKTQLEKKIGEVRERQRRKAESDHGRERLMAGDDSGIGK